MAFSIFRDLCSHYHNTFRTFSYPTNIMHTPYRPIACNKKAGNRVWLRWAALALGLSDPKLKMSPRSQPALRLPYHGDFSLTCSECPHNSSFSSLGRLLSLAAFSGDRVREEGLLLALLWATGPLPPPLGSWKREVIPVYRTESGASCSEG